MLVYVYTHTYMHTYAHAYIHEEKVKVFRLIQERNTK